MATREQRLPASEHSMAGSAQPLAAGEHSMFTCDLPLPAGEHSMFASAHGLLTRAQSLPAFDPREIRSNPCPIAPAQRRRAPAQRIIGNEHGLIGLVANNVHLKT
jgi:hypothetical protein